MGKISIVGRRKNKAFEPGQGQRPESGSHLLPGQELIEILSSVLNQSSKCVGKESHKMEASAAGISESVSINLIPEQYDLVKSNGHVKYFLNGDATGVS